MPVTQIEWELKRAGLIDSDSRCACRFIATVYYISMYAHMPKCSNTQQPNKESRPGGPMGKH